MVYIDKGTLYKGSKEIENYWLKPSHFILGETKFRRNPIITDLFLRLEYGEKMGSGLKRMENICKKENVPIPEIKIRENYFYITFKQSEDYLKLTLEIKPNSENTGINVGINAGIKQIALNDTQQKIINHIKVNISITIADLTHLINIDKRNIERNIKYLKDNGMLTRIGSKKKGYWKVNL